MRQKLGSINREWFPVNLGWLARFMSLALKWAHFLIGLWLLELTCYPRHLTMPIIS